MTPDTDARDKRWISLEQHQAACDAATRCGIRVGIERGLTQCKATHAALYSAGYEAASRLFWTGIGVGMVLGACAAGAVGRWWR